MQRREFCGSSALALLATALPASASSAVSPMKTRPINPTGYNYAEAREVSGIDRLLFVSGQVPADANDQVPADYRDQYRLAWFNVERQLKAAGMSFDNLVKFTIFLSDRSLIAKSAGLRKEILGDREPAMTIIIAGIYDESWLLEIEAIAAA